MLLTNNKKQFKICLSGGGTGGSVAPLLAIYDELKNDNKYEFIWVGTKNGIEREMLKNKKIKYFGIYSGKLRRYFSWQNIIDLLKINIGFFESIYLLLKEKPDALISAGSFASVPLVWAGWILRMPIVIHQQDAQAGLANKLMAPFAKIITVTFEKSLKKFGERAVWIGNPIRKELFDVKITKSEAYSKLGLHKEKPVLLVLGGGTGALAINEFIEKNLDELTKFCQIIHITGKEKKLVNSENINYFSFEFLDTFGLIKVFTAADIIISRCGMGVLTELAYLGKPAILIPMPDSHQEKNAEIFAQKNAAIVLNQKKITNEDFTASIKNLFSDKNLQDKLSKNIQKVIKKGANEELAKIIKSIINQ